MRFMKIPVFGLKTYMKKTDKEFPKSLKDSKKEKKNTLQNTELSEKMDLSDGF